MDLSALKTITLESSSVTASSEDEYSSATTYATDNTIKVSFESDGTTPLTPILEYISLADANLDNYPPDTPLKWGETGASNRWKMFDGYINTYTEDTSAIEVEVDSAGTDIVGLFGLTATSVTFSLVRDSVVLKTETIDLKVISGNGWYSWLHDEYEYKTKAIWSYTKYSGAIIQVSITVASGSAKCGAMVIGSQNFLGSTQYNASIGIDDYSVIATDALNRTYLSQGDYADRAEVELWINNEQIDRIRRALIATRATVCIYNLNNTGSDYDSLKILGYYKSFDIIIPGPSISKCSLDIGGII